MRSCWCREGHTSTNRCLRSHPPKLWRWTNVWQTLHCVENQVSVEWATCTHYLALKRGLLRNKPHAHSINFGACIDVKSWSSHWNLEYDHLGQGRNRKTYKCLRNAERRAIKKSIKMHAMCINFLRAREWDCDFCRMSQDVWQCCTQMHAQACGMQNDVPW